MIVVEEDGGNSSVNQSTSGFFSSRFSGVARNGKCNSYCGKIGSDGKIGSAEKHNLAFVRIRKERGIEKIRMKELRERLAAVGDKMCQGFFQKSAQKLLLLRGENSRGSLQSAQWLDDN